MSTDASLRVVGAPRRSLFDAVKPSEIQAQGSRIRGPGGMALAALRHAGVTGGALTPADGVVLGGRAFGGLREGWLAATEEGALATAYGVAAIRSRRTAGGRTWVLLRTAALRHGATLEAAALLADLDPVQLCPVIVGPREDAPRVEGLLRALGTEVFAADNDDAWSVLSALDHVARAAETGPAAIVSTRVSL